MLHTVVGLRRYPVKAMGGESLDRAEFDARGMSGDRWYAVEDDAGRSASGKDTRRFRRRDGVLAYAAVTGADGSVRVGHGDEARLVGDPGLDRQLSVDLGVPVRVRAERDVPHQDAGAVSVVGTATLAWCSERWGGQPDPRRLRVNVVVATDEPFVEEGWDLVAIGDAVLRVVGPAPRCRTIDLAQDGVEPRGRWLAGLAAERDLRLAVYADVVDPGVVGVGDEVTAR